VAVPAMSRVEIHPCRPVLKTRNNKAYEHVTEWHCAICDRRFYDADEARAHIWRKDTE
jgi:hypothetical protein